MTYSQIAWLPLSGGLTLAGLIASWFAWRRRGLAAGLRGVAWALLPLAAYLLGVIQLGWNLVSAIVTFAGSFVFSPEKWAGLIVALGSVLLFAVAGGLRRLRARKQGGQEPASTALSTRAPAAGADGVGTGAGKAAKLPAGKGKGAAAADDDFSDVEQILRRRGIR